MMGPLPIGNVLIVEDDPDMREMLATLLSTEGFHTVSAEDGLEALHLLRTVRHRAPETPCLVLLDLKMPRLGGKEFRRAQLEDPVVANVPIAVMSGATDAAERAQDLGAVATVTKPIDFDALLRIVRQVLHLARGPADRLTQSAGQHGPERCRSQHQRASRALLDHEDEERADHPADRHGRQRVGDSTEPPARTAVVLGQGPEALGTSGHSSTFSGDPVSYGRLGDCTIRPRRPSGTVVYSHSLL